MQHLPLELGYVRAYYNRGCVRTELGEFTDALADFAATVEMDDDEERRGWARDTIAAIKKHLGLPE